MPKFVVNIELVKPDGVWDVEYAKYIQEATQRWGGVISDSDAPFFPNNIKKVTVAPLGPVLRSAKGSKV